MTFTSEAPDEEFDDFSYLAANPDVADAVRKGRFRNGWHHYVRFGRSEGRTCLSPAVEVNKLHRSWLRTREAPSLAILGDVGFALGNGRSSVMSKMIAYGRWRIVEPSEADATLLYDPSGTETALGAINGRGLQTSKDVVSKIFAEAFGHDLMVDAANYDGSMVVKSNTTNGAHDGRVVHGPTTIGNNEIAQRLGNNQVGQYVQDMRVPFVGGIIPLVYFKYCPIQTRFSNTNTSVVLSSPHIAFSDDEFRKIRRFADAMNLDYGEMDILRNFDDGSLFIVDVNNIPVGPPNGLPDAEASVAVRLLSSAFERTFLQRQ